MAQLAARFGDPIDDKTFAFPTPAQLAAADEAGLAACGLGYRVKYVKGTAKMIADGIVMNQRLARWRMSSWRRNC